MGPDLALRGVAVELLGRLEDEAAIPMLELALADRETGIRLDAARGLARHPSLATPAREAQLLGAYAAAASAAERAALIGLLADVSRSATAPVFEQALRAGEATEQTAGCLALQRLAQRGHPPAEGELDRVVELLESDEPEVARACAFVLTEPVARETLAAAGRARAGVVLERLARSTVTSDAVLGVEALSVLLGREAASVLESLVGSREARIAIESVRALRRVGEPRLLAVADGELKRLVASAPAAAALRVPVLLELLAAIEADPDQPEAGALAERVLRRTAEPLAESAAPHARQARALSHCAGARLADAARRWPKELLACGHGLMPEVLRDVWIAEVFAGVVGSDDLRALQLSRLFEKGPTAVRAAVLRASASLPVKVASAQLKVGLRHADPRVVAAASLAIAARSDLRSAAAEHRIGAADLVAAYGSARGSPAATTAWLHAARAVARPAPINPAPGSSGSTPSESMAEAQEPQKARLSVVPPELIERVTQLARHSATAIRGPARALLSEWEAEVPSEVEPVADPLPVDRIPAPGAVFHVKLLTTAGEIDLELLPERAPIAAVRFLELARSGALDRLSVEQLSAGRAVAFSPEVPTGFALRHEDTGEPVERGSVLLQDHGRDALGPGFALILGRAPSLDRRAVQLGQITSGLEVADALLPGDSILEARVSTAKR